MNEMKENKYCGAPRVRGSRPRRQTIVVGSSSNKLSREASFAFCPVLPVLPVWWREIKLLPYWSRHKVGGIVTALDA